MFLKSDAIVLGRRPFSNTSLILQCYTERAGHFTVMAKGVFRRRRKAEPPSVPDLFERGEVVLYVRPYRDYAILGEWTLERPRSGLRSRYEALLAASGCAALAAGLTRDGERAGPLFGLLDRTLAEIDGGGRPRPVLWAFAFKALARAGFLAPFDSCTGCGREFGAAGARSPGRATPAGIAPAEGGIVCRSCREDGSPAGHEGQFAALPPEAGAAARFLYASPPAAASRLRVSPRGAAALERAMRLLAEYHLERPMPVLSPGKETALHRQDAKNAKKD